MTFRHNPGMIFDIISLLMMKLNPEGVYFPILVNRNHEEVDASHFEFWKNQFAEPDQKLLLFFYKQNMRSSYNLRDVFEELMREYKGELKFEQFRDQIGDQQYMTAQLLKFYLNLDFNPSISEQEYANLIRNSQQINSAEIRFFLLDYLLNQKDYLDELVNTVNQYFGQITKIYHNAMSDIVKLQEMIANQDLIQIKMSFNDSTRSIKRIQQIDANCKEKIMSVCLIMKNTIWFRYFENQEWEWIIFGPDYQQTLKLDHEERITAERIGNAIGDPNRDQIIHLILAAGEQTSSDISRKLGIALNTVSYHLQIMKEANLLLARSKGKSFYYCINPKTCEKASKMFLAWSIGQETITESEIHKLETAADLNHV